MKDKNVEYNKQSFEILALVFGEHELTAHLISHKTYNSIAPVLGYKELQLTGDEAKELVNPLQLPHMNLEDHRIYNFKGTDTSVNSIDVAEGLVAPFPVMYNGMVVSDEMYEQLASVGKQIHVTGIKVQDWEDAIGIGEHISKQYQEERDQYRQSKQLEPVFSFASHAEDASLERQMYSIMMLTALLVGAVFFIAAGSFLYFRLYTDLEQDKAHYQAIGKLGLKDSELSRIATSQLLLLFFIPLIVAIIHSVFAFQALQSLIALSIAGETFKVLAAFTIAQLIYFLFIRWRYMNHLRAALK